MQFLFPWALLSLLAVAAAAFWALARPMQKVMPVGSLRLWERAVASVGPSARKSRRFTAAWWLLLAGAAAAVVALAQPIYYAEAPARRVAVAIYPSAELAGLPEGTLAEITGPLLRRLEPTDRVKLILPVAVGGSSDFISPAEAARRISGIRLLPAAAEDLTLPAGDQNIQHLYRFAPATLKTEDGPGVTTIALPARPGEVTIDAFAVSDVGEGAVQVFVALRNHTAGPKQGEVVITGQGRPAVTLKYDLPRLARRSLISQFPGGCDYYSAVITAQQGPYSSAFAVRRMSVAIDVAIVGWSDPLVRRFVKKNPALRLIDKPSESDAVIAVGADAPADIPALIIDPPAAPEGWRKGKLLENIALGDTDTMVDHPVLAYVDLSAVAVRRAAGWRAVETPPQQRLVSIGADTLVLAGANPSRVWVAFDTATENTNFAMTESFVVFMVNVFKYLAPQARPNVFIESVSPLSAGLRRDWKAMDESAHVSVGNGPLLNPGLYRDGAGEIHAVSLTGLKSAEPQINPQRRVAGISLPEPQPLTQGRRLWGLFAVAAGVLWLSGWAIRMR
ncbi:MAG: hypothetical protein SVV80_06965 [Planctomycetota bacterium]|nr:hypothetical protein [Planctomycetota bacterium]